MAKLNYGSILLEELPLEMRQCSNQIIYRDGEDRITALATSGRFYLYTTSSYVRIYAQFNAGSSMYNQMYVSMYNESLGAWGTVSLRTSYLQEEGMTVEDILWSSGGYVTASGTSAAVNHIDTVPSRRPNLSAQSWDYSSISTFTYTLQDEESRVVIVLHRSTYTPSIMTTAATCELLYERLGDASTQESLSVYRIAAVGTGTNHSVIFGVSTGRFRLVSIAGTDSGLIDWAHPQVAYEATPAESTKTLTLNKPTRAGVWVMYCYVSSTGTSYSTSDRMRLYTFDNHDPVLRAQPSGQSGQVRLTVDVDDEPGDTRTLRYDTMSGAAFWTNPLSVLYFPMDVANRHGEAEYTHNLDAVDEVQSNSVSWSATTPEGSSAKVSVKLGDGEYQEITNGGAVPGITVGQPMPATALHIKVELDRDNGTIVPSVSNLQVNIHGVVHSSGGAITLPRMARLVLQNRAVLGNQQSDWVTEQWYYIDTRQIDPDTKLQTIHAYDSMMIGQQIYSDLTVFDEWPAAESSVVNEILGLWGMKWDSRNPTLRGYNIEYPNDLTMREVMGYIAAAYGCNLTISVEWDATANDYVPTLLFVPLAGFNNALQVGSAHTGVEAGDPLDPINKVVVWYTDTDAFESGTDDGGYRFEVDIPWATQEITTYLRSRIRNFQYVPYTCNQAKVHPLAELGDRVVFDTVSSVICSLDREYDRESFASIAANLDEEVDHEYEWQSESDRKLARKVELGKDYYGNTITREHGFRSQLVNSGAYGEFNADGIRFVDAAGNENLYYDQDEGRFVFVGSLGADAVFTESLYAESGDISELTVDSLSTSRRIKEYLMDTLGRETPEYNKDHFIRIEGISIEFVEAVPVPEADPVHVSNRYGSPLYWKGTPVDVDSSGYPIDIAGNQLYTTTVQKDSYTPVLAYEYTEYVKAAFLFKEETMSGGGTTISPQIDLGAGSSDTYPERGKAHISKDLTKLLVKYTTPSGVEETITMDDDGMVRVNGIAISVVSDYPDTELPNVLYIKT